MQPEEERDTKVPVLRIDSDTLNLIIQCSVEAALSEVERHIGPLPEPIVAAAMEVGSSAVVKTICAVMLDGPPKG